MRYTDERLRELLAAEFVLGTLHGPARRRFQRLLRDDARLRMTVAEWEERLSPMATALPDVAPHPRVWKTIEARIAAHRKPAPSWWENLALWRGLGLANGLAALVLAVWIVRLPPPPPPGAAWVTVMNDDSAQPAMLVSWPQQGGTAKRVTVRVVQKHPEMAPNTAWELWLVPAPGQAPISMGLVSTDRAQDLVLPEKVSKVLGSAWGMAMSVEPKGGSPSGTPTGPVIFQGKCFKLI